MVKNTLNQNFLKFIMFSLAYILKIIWSKIIV